MRTVVIKTIEDRRSIRRYKEDMISIEIINEVIKAGMMAPSGKNKQPWRFIVVGGNQKRKMIDALQKGIDREKNGAALLPKSKNGLLDAQNTLNIMQQAPVTIFVLDEEFGSPFNNISCEERITEMINTQSIGAAIENMLLMAENMGLGTLWIGNIFFAYQELSEWLDTDKQLVAAITIGYPDEKPSKRPRKKLNDIVEYRL